MKKLHREALKKVFIISFRRYRKTKQAELRYRSQKPKFKLSRRQQRLQNKAA